MYICNTIFLETICVFSNDVATLETSKTSCYLQCPVDSNNQCDVICWEPNRGQNNDHCHQASLRDTCSTYAGSCGCDTLTKKERNKLYQYGLLCKKPHHVSTGAFLNHNSSYTSHCTELPVFCGQKPGQKARTGRTVCPVLNSHPLPLQPWCWWGGSVIS